METQPNGTAKEIQLSRALAREINQVCEQYGYGIMPQGVLDKYYELLQFYSTQIERGDAQ